MKKIIIYIIFISFLYNLELLFSQTYPSGFCPALNCERIKELKKLLNDKDPNFIAIKKTYFKNIYDPNLPDLICYIQKDTAKLALVQNNKTRTKLFGERFIWLIIFSDYDIKDHLDVSLQVLAYQSEPRETTIRGILKIISSLIFKSAIEMGVQKDSTKDTSIKFTLTKNSCNGDTLYTYMKRFDLGLNTKNRFVVSQTDKKDKKDFLFINHNFGNFEQSRFGASLGGGVTFLNNSQDSIKVNVYVFGHYYISRPTLPVKRNILSFTLGTNFVSGKFLSDIIVGFKYENPWFSPLGFVSGINFISQAKQIRVGHFFCGLDYRL